jgi:hypothetical protein
MGIIDHVLDLYRNPTKWWVNEVVLFNIVDWY